MDLLDRLLAHDAWTTSRLLEQSRALSEAQLDTNFDLGHQTVRLTFAHVIYNLEVWTALMEGRDARALEERFTLGALEQRLKQTAPRLAALACRIRDQQLWDALWTDTLDNPPRQKTYGGGIGHILTHGVHHRAQIIHMLKRLGVKGVLEGDLLSWEAQSVS